MLVRSALLFTLAWTSWAADGLPLGNADTDAWSKHAQADDGIFPALGATAAAFSFDTQSFLLAGKPFFAASGSIHYARVPRELWRDRLLRLRRLGYTMVETYVFWNWHEQHEGQFDFSGDRDLGAFLDLAQELGLKALVRVGPYSCAEWTEGGFPSWLRTNAGMRLRVDDPVYLAAVDRWFTRLLPIVAKHQVDHGGPVVMLQLENEHPSGGGTRANDQGKVYFSKLLEVARASGISVPLFFSGMHHSHDPAGDQPWDPTGRANPWMSTEFWTSWYSNRGAGDEHGWRAKARSAWKMVAFGAGGYNCYMAHGGTSFGLWNNDEVQASYDFGAPIGQIGDFRPLGHRLHELNLFATTYADLLAAAPRCEPVAPPAAGLRAWRRHGTAGTALFLDNPSDQPVSVALPGGRITLAPQEIAPVVGDLVLTKGVTLVRCPARMLARLHHGRSTTVAVLLDGEAPTTLGLLVDGIPRVIALQLGPAGAPAAAEVTQGEEQVRFVGIGPRDRERTWVVDEAGGQLLVVGSGMPVSVGLDQVTAEGGGPEVRVSDGAGLHLLRSSTPSPATAGAMRLGTWTMARADGDAAPSTRDEAWTNSVEPLQLGLDGSTTAWGWYRTHLTLAAPFDGLLRLDQLADEGQVFIDGRSVGTCTRQADLVPVRMTSGDHLLTVFAGFGGRDKMFFNTGVMATNDRKGLYGAPRLLTPGTGGSQLATWRWRQVMGEQTGSGAERQAEVTRLMQSDVREPKWADLTFGADLFARTPGRALAIASFARPQGSEVELRFAPIDDQAEIWVNGVRIGDHRGWNTPFTLAVPATALHPGSNTLAVVVGNSDGPGGMSGAVEVRSFDPVPGMGDGRVRGWRLHEVAELPPTSGYTPLAGAPGVPAYFRTDLLLPTGAPTAAVRLTWEGLGQGQAWINGHALGRFPDHLDGRGLWLPPCWLKSGSNEIVFFDAHGGEPSAVRVVVDAESPDPMRTYLK